MIWFNPDNDSGFDLGTPDWSGESVKVTDNVTVSNIVIGQGFTRPPPKAQMPQPPEPELPPPPPPEPQVDPRVENNLKLLAASISELAKIKREIDQRDLNFCIELAFGIAEELVCGTIDANPEKVLDIVKESLGMFEDTDHPVVKLHPDIMDALKEHEMLQEISNTDGVTIKSDESVSTMGCIVTANRKSIDGQALERLKRIRTLFDLEQGKL